MKGESEMRPKKLDEWPANDLKILKSNQLAEDRF